MVIDSLQYNGLCTCGKEHKMETVFSIVESGCLKDLSKYLSKYDLLGSKVAVYDKNTYLATADRHPAVDFEVILDPENLHANEHGVAALMEQLPEKADILIAIGSGTVHDITRYCAYEKGLRFVSCPTAASVDGFCSSVAAMTWNGCKKTLTAVAPTIVVADIDIIKKAPIRLARSGFGDMVGKYVALTDWKIANILTNDFYCTKIAKMTLKATEAVVNSAEGIVRGEESAYENLMYGLLLSGLAMQMMGNSKPASGAEHHISHIIEMEPKGLGVHSDALHGEKVGVGTLLAIEEYQRICARADIVFKDYAPFSADFIMQIFGEEMSGDIFRENEKDSAAGVTAETLTKNWEKVCAELKKLPDIRFLQELYANSGIKSKLSDIDVADEKAAQLLDCSPAVRNRLTLMRLRRCLG